MNTTEVIGERNNPFIVIASFIYISLKKIINVVCTDHIDMYDDTFADWRRCERYHLLAQYTF